jgi:hypothetical protein
LNGISYNLNFLNPNWNQVWKLWLW